MLMNNIEIERKYLVNSDIYLQLATEHHELCQGYLCADGKRTVRVRIKDDQGFLTIKGKGNGISRFEWEHPIPADDARQLLQLCLPGQVSKTRYIVPLQDTLKVEVDVFHGDNQGLVFAEVELPSEDYPLTLPEWLGKEVTGDPRYYNSYIAAHPFNIWND